MVKVVYFNWFGVNQVGGIELYLKTLIEYLLVNKLADVKLVCGDEKISESQIKYQIETNLLNRYTETGDLEINTFYQNNRSILESADIFHFHNIHVFNPSKMEGLINFLHKKYPFKIFIASLHNIPKDFESGRTVIHNFPGRIVSCSKYLKDVIYEVYGKDSDILQYYFGLPTNKDMAYDYKSSKITFLQPTRFSNWKGSHLSLLAFSKLYKKGIRNFLYIHGGIDRLELRNNWDGRWADTYPNLLEDTEQLVREDLVKFIKYNPEESYRVLNNCHYILHPTIGRGINGDPNPIAILQSMLLGKTIIGSNSGNIPVMLRNVKRKYLVEAGNFDSLYKILNHIIDNKILPATNSTEAKLFRDIDLSPANHLKFYNNLLKGS